MPIPPSLEAATAAVRYVDILSDDGTVIRAWTNDPMATIDGPTIVLCNGLGTSPWVWPALLAPKGGVRVVSWNHRGTGGSPRPVDPTAVGVSDFVADALSVMDHFGVGRTVLVGWSVGVATMFELAAAHPERVAGLFAVAGVPGSPFPATLGPCGVPAPVADLLARAWSQTWCLAGPLVSPLARRIPVGPRTVTALARARVLGTIPDPAHPDHLAFAALALAEFLRTPVEWYFHLALRSADHRFASVRRIQVPVRFVAGTFDLVASSRRMAAVAAQMPQAELIRLRGSHLLPLEHPDRVHRLLVDFLERVAGSALRR